MMNYKTAQMQECLITLRRTLEQGKLKAEGGCVASEALGVFTACLEETKKAHLLLLSVMYDDPK